MQKPSVEQLRKSIDQARKAHDDPTVKALSDMLYDATGVHEPEFAPVESSGDPKLDSLRRALVQAVAARDEPTEATLRGMIKDIEGEPLPEVNVELTEEEPVEVVEEEAIENPFDIPEEVEVDELEEELFEPDEEDFLIEDLMKDALMATQISALQKAGLLTEEDIRCYVEAAGESRLESLVSISGIGRSSAETILETLDYEA